LCRAAGRDVRDAEFTLQLAAAAGPVRGGFAAFAATLPEPAKGGLDGGLTRRAGAADEPARQGGTVPIRIEVLDAESGPSRRGSTCGARTVPGTFQSRRPPAGWRSRTTRPPSVNPRLSRCTPPSRTACSLSVSPPGRSLHLYMK
jgi:hypothetical protein